MALNIGARIGTYEVLSAIGAGGMGEVYRAHDTRLGRDVAIKILPAAFTSDPDRLARFEREARMLASLNHPNIAAIHGIEEADPSTGSGQVAISALVLELVEGETLADRIQRNGSGLQLSEALAIARQIAEALDAAHEKGIVHRDLKPANIKITPDGVVKVLDFGLAKAVAEEPQADLSHSPTATVAGTRGGVILGTAAYMSPEQARGKAVDKRTDIWAFGCVFYEMLTGRSAFGRETVSDTIAAILERAPEWAALPAATPPAINRLLRRCLDKDPRRRLRDIGDARLELDDMASVPAATVSIASRRVPVWSAFAVGIVIGATAAATIARSRPALPPQSPTRFSFTAPAEGWRLVGPAVPSPDGRQIAFVAESAARESALWIRSMDSQTPRRIDGTEGATGPFWSPNGQFVGFIVPSEGRLRRIDLSSGPILNVCNITGAVLGATWNQDGVILLAPDNRVPLYRVPASGGTPQPITTLDPARRENSHRWPHFLPDGRRFLYTARSDVKENTGIYVGTLDSTERTWLVEAQSSAVYAAPGYLLFVREGTLLAQRFDATTLELSGEPVALAGSVEQATTSASASFSASANGRVVTYRTEEARASHLVWFDRDGVKGEPTRLDGAFSQLRLAPDGKRAAVVTADRDSGNRDIWLADLTDGTLMRLTTHPANDWFPVWSPDGTEIAFASDRNGASTVYRKATNSNSESEEIVPSAAVSGNIFPNDWSPDGRLLAVHVSTPAAQLDLWTVGLTGDRSPARLTQTKFQEQTATFSPDGRWIAYVSDESGMPDVYVQALGRGGRQRVSSSGGINPRWRRDSRELFFVDAANNFMSVSVGVGDTFVGSLPIALFNACATSGEPYHYRYDIAADGQRSLWLCPTPRDAPSQVTVFVDWAAQLERRGR